MEPISTMAATVAAVVISLGPTFMWTTLVAYGISKIHNLCKDDDEKEQDINLVKVNECLTNRVEDLEEQKDMLEKQVCRAKCNDAKRNVSYYDIEAMEMKIRRH